MESERTVTIVIGPDSVGSKPPAEAITAGLRAPVAAVLSTYRSTSPDWVLDHALWLACIHAVTHAVQADQVQVFGERFPQMFDCLRRPRNAPELGTMEAYATRLTEDPDPPQWGLVHWRRGGLLVAVAVAEPWYSVGGPAPYHDSYTTRVFLAPGTMGDVVSRVRLQIEEQGGCVDRVINLPVS